MQAAMPSHMKHTYRAVYLNSFGQQLSDQSEVFLSQLEDAGRHVRHVKLFGSVLHVQHKRVHSYSCV